MVSVSGVIAMALAALVWGIVCLEQAVVYRHTVGHRLSAAPPGPRPGPLSSLAEWYDRLPFARRQQVQLSAAGAPMRPAAYAAALLAGAVIIGLLARGVAGLPGFWGVAVGVLSAPAAGEGLIRARVRARAARMADQWPDVVRSLARSVRSGLTVPQALARAAETAPVPAGEPLAQAVRALALGDPLPQALKYLRPALPQAAVLATALALHQQLGGDLARMLDWMAASMAEQRTAVRQIRAMTAEARAAGQLVPIMPLAGIIIFNLIEPGVTRMLFRPAGLALAAGCLSVQAVGWWLIRRLAQVEV